MLVEKLLFMLVVMGVYALAGLCIASILEHKPMLTILAEIFRKEK